ncbi:Electron transport complex protein RnfA [uncultured Gammaproteobacteria bacterium]|nr:Electron transport complex protein RnfA [uncultured Gammaproteobacteria bacterium]
MNEYILILISTILVNNFVLVKFLGLCPFMGVSKKVETAIGMGFATTFVLTLASVSSYLINTYILVPFEMEYLRTIAFIVTIAGVVGFTELVVNKTSPVLHQSLGVFLPLITTNCAVLGVALLNVNQDNGFLHQPCMVLVRQLAFLLCWCCSQVFVSDLRGQMCLSFFKVCQLRLLPQG